MLNTFYYKQKLENLLNSDLEMAVVAGVFGNSEHNLSQQTTGNS